ncbi:hypothetical protein EKO27_g12011 [Xylaria grammica]|uniref:Uncharacterized protein n=1 Tax=Xylaria grammica TaxID=363999 RepID=A0A439CLS6_9PEZI|nr:hypothetical protein EKO27_g12011 [Xylaria grammica]
MFANRGQIKASTLSLDSLSMENHLEEGDSDTDSSHFETATPLVAKHYFQFYHQAVADIRESPVNLGVWFLSALFLAAVEIVISTFGFAKFKFENFCTVDGSFQLGLERDIFAISDFFRVNIATGNLTFTQAKVVDTTWDLVRPRPALFYAAWWLSSIMLEELIFASQIVGRGGQATLSLITWKVFAKYAAMCMTIRPITFATYRVLFTDNGPSISSTASLLHDFIKFKGLASKLASTFLIYSILFALAFSTLAGSATGYTPLNEAFVQAYDGNLVPTSSFAQLQDDMEFPWEYSNRTYPKDDIERRGVCVPVKNVS